MSQFAHTENRPRATSEHTQFVDYKAVEELRRMLTPNGKILSRKRLGASARAQRNIARAIKRARFMALLPYTSATL
ncbi:MAG: 30S ribosomal protein S18 [Phycisphaerales bacterium]|nr:30S ribosomal protein S18 [Phycisphaerales bacterium]